MRKIKNQKKYFAVFTKNEYEVQNVVGIKKITSTTDKVSYKNKTYIVQTEFPSYIKGKKIFYFFNLKEGQLLFNKTSVNSVINPEIIDSILSKNIINQLTSNLNSKWKVELPLMIFSCLFGAMLGFIIGNYV